MATAFVRAANPIWFMVDLEGNPLNDEYYIFYLENVFPYLPQTVYHDPDGTIPWNNPIQFFPNGTLPDNVYFDNSLVYRLEVRHGNTQSDALIYKVNNFVPGNDGGGSSSTSSSITDNQATNPQFSEISFSSPLSITTSGTYNVAPGWDLVLTGGGTATVTQVISISNQDQINNPPYALRINTNGFTTAQLVQRLNNNGAIWSSTDDQDSGVSMSITAAANNDDYFVSLLYVPSQTVQSYDPIASGTIATGDFQVLDGSIKLPIADNIDSSDVAYVDMIINLQGTGEIEISNVQIIGFSVPVNTDVPDPPAYEQETIERGIDHLFHYYRDSIIFQPKNSIITGWNFPLNPYQIITSAVTTQVALTDYCADQTILHQEGASRLNSGAAAANVRGGLQVGAVTAATGSRFALIQYIDPSTVKPYWSYILSSLVKARIFTTHSTQVGIKMRLIYRSTLPSAIGNTEPITGWDVNNDVTFSAGWTAIEPINDPTYILPNAYDDSTYNTFPEFSFNGFQLPNGTGSTDVLGIVIYTTANLDSTATADYVVFDKISLVPNEFAIDTHPQTFDEVLRQCQFYYEKSYDSGSYPTGHTQKGCLVMPMSVNRAGASFDGFAAPFEFEFSSVKRAAPTLTFYAFNSSVAADVINKVNAYYYQDGTQVVSAANSLKTFATYFTQAFVSTKSVGYVSTASPGALVTGSGYTDNAASTISFQYLADARLGV